MTAPTPLRVIPGYASSLPKLASVLLAALIVGGVLLAIAVALGLWGRNAISAASLAPTRSLHSLQRDSQILSERVSG